MMPPTAGQFGNGVLNMNEYLKNHVETFRSYQEDNNIKGQVLKTTLRETTPQLFCSRPFC